MTWNVAPFVAKRLTEDEISGLNSYLYTKWNAYIPTQYGSNLFIQCEQVSTSSGNLYLYIDRPEFEYIPLIVWNRSVESNLQLYTSCATYGQNSGVTLYSSGVYSPSSILPLYVFGNDPVYTGVGSLYS